jgi:hypothetical protein
MSSSGEAHRARITAAVVRNFCRAVHSHTGRRAAPGPGWVRLPTNRPPLGRHGALFTRRGHDWTDRYPAIAGAAAKLRAKSFTMDGEAVVTGADGVAVFDALHRRHKATNAMLYAFDLLEFNRKLPGIFGVSH